MNADLIKRLKALNPAVTDRKIASLIEAGFSEQQIEHVMSEIYQPRVIQKAIYGPIELVAYKGASMKPNADYDALETGFSILDRVKDRLGLPASLEVARAMVRTGADLEVGRAVVEKDDSGVRARYKDSSLYAQAINAAGQEMVDKVLQALIAKATGGGRSTLTSSGEQSVATKAALRDPMSAALMGTVATATKATTPDPIALAFQGTLESDRRPR